MFFVYILYSEKGNRFYIGQTSDIDARLARHNGGMERSTSAYVPWKLVCIIEKPSRSEALLLEKKLKNLNGDRRITMQFTPSLPKCKKTQFVELSLLLFSEF